MRLWFFFINTEEYNIRNRSFTFWSENIKPAWLGLLGNVCRAHEICQSSRTSICGIDFFWSYHTDFFQISVGVHEAYTRTFVYFIFLNRVIFVTMGQSPRGAKNKFNATPLTNWSRKFLNFSWIFVLIVLTKQRLGLFNFELSIFNDFQNENSKFTTAPYVLLSYAIYIVPVRWPSG